jgi:hypothetical protein
VDVAGHSPSEGKAASTLSPGVAGQSREARIAATRLSQLNDGLLATNSLTATAAEDGEFVSTVVVTLCPKYVAQITGIASSTPTPTKH